MARTDASITRELTEWLSTIDRVVTPVSATYRRNRLVDYAIRHSTCTAEFRRYRRLIDNLVPPAPGN